MEEHQILDVNFLNEWSSENPLDPSLFLEPETQSLFDDPTIFFPTESYSSDSADSSATDFVFGMGSDTSSPTQVWTTDAQIEFLPEVEELPLEETSVEPQTKKAKTRKRKLSTEDTNVDRVTLSREDLLHMSSAEYEDKISALIQSQPPTKAEQKFINKQRRLIKNRESAQLSRTKKKEYVTQLEQEISQLKSTNYQLNEKVNRLEVENRGLREELQRLSSNITSGVGKLLNNIKQVSMPSAPMSLRTKTNASLALMMLFSFGLLFQSQFGIQTAPPQGNQYSMTEIPAGRAVGREIMGLIPEKEMPEPETLEKTSSPSFKTHSQSQLKFDQTPENPRKRGRTERPFPPHHDETELGQFSKMRVEEEINAEDTNFKTEFMNESSKYDLGKAEFATWLSNRSRSRPNTAFFLAPEIKQIVPEDSPTIDSNAPLFVTILIPSNSLAKGVSLPSNSENVTDGIIEVTTQVVEISVTPFQQVILPREMKVN